MIGYQYIEDEGLTWRYNQGGLFPLSPPGAFHAVSYKKARDLMSGGGAHFIRWETDFDSGEVGAWWHVIKDRFDDLEELPKKTRYMVRKAQKRYVAKIVDRSYIADHGYDVYSSAYERYQTHEPLMDRSGFRYAVSSLPERTEFWGVFEGDRMVAFSENYIESDICFYVTMWLDPEAMSNFAGYLLFYRMEQNYLSDRGFKYVSDGARSLSHDTNIHNFLISKFRFRKAYASLNVVYGLWLGLAINLAYPVRHLINLVPIGIFHKAGILLQQEEIRRQCLERLPR